MRRHVVVKVCDGCKVEGADVQRWRVARGHTDPITRVDLCSACSEPLRRYLQSVARPRRRAVVAESTAEDIRRARNPK